ncbi:alpha-amylase family glycosyl hydrolase [Gelidibacter pelagius]|uniref:Alpha-glucosidase C-terminal domain-containing protein n=1 Tax=Gelidibacter pelagius TaxID=2819985 RepID=A0ABS3STC5_9FLAO|nr:alpha-amylase family glycosyl hydrolase [Gelidibacter pelagius]MBO3098153.1 alpha-glucosidase C-terminal domain-containing protein [Gelidibacter pelagius]
MKNIVSLTCLALIVISCKQNTQQLANNSEKEHLINWNDEIIYHVMPRSFYDSNGDRHGDLNGFVEKLDYLKELGVTTILFTPLYESGFYHNYFPTDYEKIDPEYGTMEEYIRFIKAVHSKGLKFLMDMETQYAQGEHRWFADSYKNPDSEYSDFIYYTDSLNKYPEQIFMPAKSELFDFKTWPNTESHHIVILDLQNQRVKDWMINFYKFWVDPNQDGSFEDGVDGFRIDHIMDDLDHKGILTNLYKDLWKPIFEACKEVNPDIFILGEQSDWGDYGDVMVKESGADAAFNFSLKFALTSEAKANDMYKSTETLGVHMDPQAIHRAVNENLKRFKDHTYAITFLENHDVARFATLSGNEDQMRLGGVLNLLLPGVPSIYYGQELGVTGKIHEWGSDVNHLPLREAFPWTPDYNDEGTAVFYKDSGEWWDISFWNTDTPKKLALSVQQKDETSLWNHYRKVIALRKDNAAFRRGTYEPILNDHLDVLAFKRAYEDETFAVVANVSNAEITVADFNLKQWQTDPVYGELHVNAEGELTLPPYGYAILKK